MTELEAMTRADQIVQHHLDNPLELRSFVAHCMLADARIAAQDATIALLRAEVRAWRTHAAEPVGGIREREVVDARAATDAAGALG